MWFRRDLRLADNPALGAAAHESAEVAPLFVQDPALWGPSGDVRRLWLARSVTALDAGLGGALLVRRGDPVHEVVRVARAAGAAEVHVAADFGPYGRERDTRVEEALLEHGITLVRTGSPYAVAPGRVTKPDHTPYRVFTPFSRAWAAHGWRRPADPVGPVRWISPVASQGLPKEPRVHGLTLPEVGERAALQRWAAFRDERLGAYEQDRNRPDLDRTSGMSAHLKYGEVHPRTLLADLAERHGKGADTYRTELCWREFYADVLWHEPQSARVSLRPEMRAMRVDSGKAADDRFAAWVGGRTGYPAVDAAMRQLAAEGWMHNRMRMVTASFLIKDLHLDWGRGARHFMQALRDGDLASNNHGWQWTAGTGTDAAPYFRIFNPVSQGQKFDPEGDYVRRYVPELRSVPGKAVHEPWTRPDGLPAGYPERIVQHDVERRESLERYQALRA